MDYAGLKTEIQTGPLASELAPYIASGNDTAIAAALSSYLTEIMPVHINVLGAWAAQTGVRAAVQDAADTPGHTLRSIALTAIDLLRGNMTQTFDTIVYGGLLDAMQAGGLMTQAHRDALTALATKPMSVTANDVARAIRNDDGSSKL